MNQEIKQTELHLLKIQLKVQPTLDGWFFKRVELDKPNKINPYHAQEFTEKDKLFEGLNPTHYNFDYRRPLKQWDKYNEVE